MERMGAWDWIVAGFWLAFGLAAGSVAVTIVVMAVLLGLGWVSASELRP